MIGNDVIDRAQSNGDELVLQKIFTDDEQLLIENTNPEL
jgi:hypothetical protein